MQQAQSKIQPALPELGISAAKSKIEHGSRVLFEEPRGSDKASVMLELTSHPLLEVLHADSPERSPHNLWLWEAAIAPDAGKRPQMLLRDGEFTTKRVFEVHLIEF